QKYRLENTSIQESEKDYLVVRSDRKMIKINFADILYVESLSDYVKLHCTNQTIITRETITALEAKLPSNAFIRIHRSFIVSINAISSYTNEYVEIQGSSLTISRSYRSTFLRKMEGE
ncbi:MAG: LytTR family transcriptional regulator, partial [Bacteroidales bacterium]|nr:LytTR family transcriptional regulator [Bacteroidales bacterium]